MIKYNWLKLLNKTTLLSIICLFIFITTSCTNNQINSSQVETIETPLVATNSSAVETNQTASTKNNSTTEKLPAKIKESVLSDAKKRISKPETALRITQSQKQNWGDSCLGLAKPGQLCAQVIVSGWKVVVTDGQRELVYRTDREGKQVKLEN
ncbi:MAG: hypothetical protein MJK14_06580 [Rivularia sp. ALOHA_DT_140]|nr:hypothetical protein [Rivularia sp. ALOHA_DT_140]